MAVRLALFAAALSIGVASTYAATGKVLWSQHEETAIYQNVGASKAGFAIASTWLSQPFLAEIFTLADGNKTVKEVTDPKGNDETFDMAISRASTTAVATKSAAGVFDTTVYKWNATDKNTKPDWTTVLKNTIASSVDVTDDGSVIAIGGVTNVSYYEPPILEILFLDGDSGKEIVEARSIGKVNDQPISLEVSGDGQYAVYTLFNSKERLDYVEVLHVMSGSKHRQILGFPLKSASGSSLGISRDGMYVAVAGNSDFTLFKRETINATNFEYKEYMTHTLPSGSIYGEDVLDFSVDGEYVAVGGFAEPTPALQPLVLGFHVPTKTVSLNVTYPASAGQDQNVPSGISVSESGKFVAVATWGTQNNDPGTEQVQVFQIGSKDPIYSFFTAGSPFGISLTEMGDNKLFVIAGGKHVPANQMGNGGDLYAFEIVVPGMSLDPNAIFPQEELVADVNNNPSATWTAEISVDLINKTNQEVIQKAGGTFLAHVHPAQPTESTARTEFSPIPDEFDASKEWPHCIGPIRNQLQCGSCWAFGAVTALSDRTCISTGAAHQYVALSPEYVLDCDLNDNGCGGGYLKYAWDFLAKTGTVSDGCVPYTSGQGTGSPCETKCKNATQSFKKYRIKASTVTELQGVEAMQREIMTNGPIESAYSVFSDFMNYKSGVYNHVSGIFLGGHAVRVVGWGTVDDTPYWKIANSWGADWGMEGFFLMERGVDECYIESNAIAALPITK